MGTLDKIIIVPGWTYSIDRWFNFKRILEKAGYDVETLIIPGLTTPSKKVWSLESYVDWLKQTLDKEGSKVVLVGHSSGGRIVLSYAAKYPDSLKKLVLIDSAGIFHNELPTKLKRFVFKIFSKIGKKIGLFKNFRWVIYKLAREHDYEKASLNMRKTMKNLIYLDLSPILKEVKVPTLIIWGEKDKITPLSDALVMKRDIKNSKLKIIKAARHSPFYTHSKEAAKFLLEEI